MCLDFCQKSCYSSFSALKKLSHFQNHSNEKSETTIVKSCLYETSQISECYSVKMKAAMKQKRLVRLGQMFLTIIEYPKHDWHSVFGHKRLCYRRATAGTFILNLLYNKKVTLFFGLDKLRKCELWDSFECNRLHTANR